jgi:hypothetical protein
MSAFSGFSASTQAFANNYGGIVRGHTDPASFFSALQNSRKFGIFPGNGKPVPSYIPDGVGTEKGIEAGLICTP